MNVRIARAIATLALAAFLLVPAAAFGAEAPILDQYGNPTVTDAVGDTDAQPDAVNAEGESGTGAGVEAGGDVDGAAVTAAATVGDLPFTGSELGALAFAALALLGSGLALRRVGFAKSRRVASPRA